MSSFLNKNLKPIRLMKLSKGTKEAIQFTLAGVVLIAGIALVFISLFIPPRGVIDPSVITAFGLFLGFVGAVWGLDLKYDYKTRELVDRYRMRMNPGSDDPFKESEAEEE